MQQEVYDQLEAKVNEMITSGNLDEKRQIAYQSFLFIIMYAPIRCLMRVEANISTAVIGHSD